MCNVTHVRIVGSSSRWRLGLLATSAFVFVTSELLPVGAMPVLVADLGASEGQVGRLLTVYAALVAVTAVPAVRLTRTVNRRVLVSFAVLVMAVSNGLAALAPSLGWLMAARLLIATTHGLFWSIIGSVASRLAPAGRAGAATSVVFAGNALALIAGVPVVNAVSTWVGWRLSLVGVAVVAGAVGIALYAALPPLPAEAPPAPRRGRDVQAMRRVCGVAVTTLLTVTAYFATYTYITSILTTSPVTSRNQPLFLLLYGSVGLVGILVCGRWVDRAPRAVITVQSLLGVTAYLLLGVTQSPLHLLVPAALLLLSLGYAGMAVSWQAAALRAAPAAPDLASAVYVVAFQIGIAIGPVIGGLFVDRNDLFVVPLVSAGVAAGGMVAAASASAFSHARPCRP